MSISRPHAPWRSIRSDRARVGWRVNGKRRPDLDGAEELDVWVFGKTAGEYATSRASADDHLVRAYAALLQGARCPQGHGATQALSPARECRRHRALGQTFSRNRVHRSHAQGDCRVDRYPGALGLSSEGPHMMAGDQHMRKLRELRKSCPLRLLCRAPQRTSSMRFRLSERFEDGLASNHIGRGADAHAAQPENAQ